MNLIQLRSLCEIVDHGLHISEAATAAYRSQPSISRQVKELESELGFEIFVRRKNRILAITPQGEKVVEIARRMVGDAQSIRRLGNDYLGSDEGEFVIATTHTQARYVLPDVIDKFIKRHPMVRLSLRQGTPSQCEELVRLGHADLALCAALKISDELGRIRCFRLDRSVFTLPRHPLLRAKPLTLETLAKYPLITYERGYSGRDIVDRTFAEQGLQPRIVLSAVDADVCKVYVARGLGIAIFATITYERVRDKHIRCTDVSHLFEPSYLDILARRQAYLQSYMIDFIQMLCPHMSRETIKLALGGKSRPVEHARG